MYTDGGERTSVQGCDAKVAVIDGLKSGRLLEVLVVADPKDLAKPGKLFDLAQDSVRLIVLPPKDLDEYLGKVPVLESERGQKNNKLDGRAAVLEARAAEYRRAVDVLATSVWRGLVAPKNRLYALDKPVADQIYEDIMPRRMAPAQPVEGTARPFIKDWRPITEEDYNLLRKQHFECPERNLEVDGDLAALNRITIRSTVPGKTKSRMWPLVVGQRLLEYAVVFVAVAGLQHWLCTSSYWDDVRGSVTTGNGGADGGRAELTNGTMAQALQQVGTTKGPSLLTKIFNSWNTMIGDHVRDVASIKEIPPLPLGRYANHDLYDRYGVFVDPKTKTDLQSFRAPRERCANMINEPAATTDINLQGKLLKTDYNLCGSNVNGTLVCRDLKIRNPQCFQFVSGQPDDPRGLFSLWDMMDRIFVLKGDECFLRCDDPERVKSNLLDRKVIARRSDIRPADEMQLYRTAPAWKIMGNDTSTQTTPNSTETTANSTLAANSTQTTPSSTQTTPSSTQTTPYSTQTTPNSTLAANSTQAPYSTQTTPYPTQTTPYPTETTPSSTQTTPYSTQSTPYSTQNTPNSTLTANSTQTPYSTQTAPSSTHSMDLMNRLPMGQWVKQDSLNKYGLFIDPKTGIDLQSYRAPWDKCQEMIGQRNDMDNRVDELLPTDHELCGRENGTLKCQNLRVRNPQCFQFVSGDANDPRGLYFLWDMIDRIFHLVGKEDCVIRCDHADAMKDRLVEAARMRVKPTVVDYSETGDYTEAPAIRQGPYYTGNYPETTPNSTQTTPHSTQTTANSTQTTANSTQTAEAIARDFVTKAVGMAAKAIRDELEMAAEMTKGTGLDRYRSSNDKCEDIDFNPQPTDILMQGPGHTLRLDTDPCGSGNNATLLARGLGGIRSSQCFDFISDDAWNSGTPLVKDGTFFSLWFKLGQVFGRTGREEYIVRCHDTDKMRDKLLMAASRDNRVETLYDTTGLGVARTPEALERFVQIVKSKYPPTIVADRKEELSDIWFNAPCGTGVWTTQDDYPNCVCQQLSVTCEMADRQHVRLDTVFDAEYDDPSESVRGRVFRDHILPISDMPGMQIKRCLYQCLTKILFD
ncbi:hypothetical protein GNI_119810 [Gregarina niphandrodes]|uniref:Uncharacterized protein n=1 Tax=Gregarina niphandrodes TaxID=110365 RepID=A0A023B2L2_GRENI|nr:hypothetical protein GNI_119810 [Gregarina niphandrodes]EZG54811.1 hypothetical protein GNI_119810 [Gregarina niphandrodes]|eukprot:XP_011131825.1 hypothetical protein GNI_119810 [Gregarina niphandrodes]